MTGGPSGRLTCAVQRSRGSRATAGLRMAAMSLVIALFTAGCGQDIKQENERLKAQVSALQKENVTLKGEATSLRADVEALKKQLEILAQDKQALEDKVKELEAKIAVKSATRPPQKPKKMQMP